MGRAHGLNDTGINNLVSVDQQEGIVWAVASLEQRVATSELI
jgi:hypothetical protein